MEQLANSGRIRVESPQVLPETITSSKRLSRIVGVLYLFVFGVSAVRTV